MSYDKLRENDLDHSLLEVNALHKWKIIWSYDKTNDYSLDHNLLDKMLNYWVGGLKGTIFDSRTHEFRCDQPKRLELEPNFSWKSSN